LNKETSDMPAPFADLHTHTTASDGTFTPTELVQAACAAGLTYIAITDHDTTAGIAEARRAAAGTELRFLPGVELSADGPPGKCHLLGLGINPNDAPLNETLAALSENRRQRNEKMAARLRALGIEITLEEVTAAAPAGANVGRPHFAQVLWEKGIVHSTKEAFDRFLGDGKSGFIEKETLSPAEAIRLVQEAGGFCFLAHPSLVRLAAQETDETRLTALKELGIDGVEVYYSQHTPAQTEKYRRLADKLGLMITGGSDFHGANKPDIALGAVWDDKPLPAALLPQALLAKADDEKK
jgi:3',5'-nucleoside bisphosphate phosphatase